MKLPNLILRRPVLRLSGPNTVALRSLDPTLAIGSSDENS